MTEDELRAEVIELRMQLATVATLLLEEATEREWCDEYGTFVDKVNARCGAQVLEHCRSEWDIRLTVNLTVGGRNADDARTAAREAMAMFGDRVNDSVSWDIENVERC